MKNYFITERLRIGPLTYKNAAFILELINTPGWLKFIGDGNVKNLKDARAYIQKIKHLLNTKYWVVYIKDQNIPIGIITFIKRDYLDHHDIGFAFLPGFTKLGYAFEATATVLNSLHTNPCIKSILATTVPENFNSIILLGKFGFLFEKQFTVEGVSLLLYKLHFDLAGS
jgi:ribosomal-protein-alanine N-acetyltransferase